MKAIFNREFNSYFTSMIGYVFLTIFLLLTGIMFYMVNIGYMTASMTGFFASVNNVAIFFLPLLTMRLFSEDRKLKTDQLLLTAPISTKEIVLGKFFAAFAVFMTGVVITLIYPVMLAIWGSLPFGETISCYIGFILLCSLILSIGAFMSSVTESQIVAAVATYGVLIFTMLLNSISTYVSNEAVVNILLWLSPLQRFSDFTLGIMSFEPIIYYMSLTGLFLFFTTMVFERRRLR
ncbi:MAG: ABC transporter permease [Clostridia bacterium]|nr:ABC transporter permease [Clostridia bacterium]